MENSLSTELPEIMDFFGLKKKKKVRFIKDDHGFFQKDPQQEEIDVPTHTITIDAPVEDICLDNDLSFDLTKKKKKKKINVEEIIPSTDEADSTINLNYISSSLSDNAEYTYEDLLTRVFAIMREKDPNRDMENRKKLVMKPPQCIRIGSKKTSFVNFLEICKMLHRTPQHMQQFLLVELGTTGSVDGNYQLIIKGRFEQRQIENVLRRYIKEYVTCHTCKSPDTILQKDTRLFFLQCESCGSRCSVTSVKSGFQAVTGKRAAMRAKTS